MMSLFLGGFAFLTRVFHVLPLSRGGLIVTTMLRSRICELCGQSCKDSELVRDESGGCYHHSCYRDCLEQHGANSSESTRVVPNGEHAEEPSCDTSTLSLFQRLMFGMIHAVLGAFLGFVGAFSGDGGRIRSGVTREHYDPDTLVKIMLLCSLFGFIGGVIGGKFGWAHFHNYYSADLSTAKRGHLVCIAAFVLLIIFVIFQLFYLDLV